jgi:flagellar basal-body rod protein FlgF
MNTLEIAAIGLQQSTERLRIVSHNVANISTPGYKRQIAVSGAFSNAFDAAHATVSAQTDLGPGKLRATGNPLDVALGDREFLAVQTLGGAPALVRGGSLKVDARGRLVTEGGLPVQGTAGDLMVPTTATRVRIDVAGRVLADEQQVGALRIIRVASGEPMSSLGEGLFAWPSGSGVQSVQAPALQVGHQEASNVSGTREMVDLITTTRHAEAMIKLIQGSDELLEKTIRKLGEI